jgi:hypothetical protein
MVKIEHWPESGMLRVDLKDGTDDYGREVAPGVVFHYRRGEEEDELVSIEIEDWPDRDLRNVSFEQRDDEGNVVFQTLNRGALDHVPGKKVRGDG